MPETDSKPWYRYFWPWFIIFLLTAAVSGSLFTLYLASTTAEPVLPSYQDQQ